LCRLDSLLTLVYSTIEQERLLKERDLATKSASDLQIQLASLTKQLTDQSRSLKSAEDSLSRSVDDNKSMRKLLDDKVSDQQRQAETNRIAEDKLQDLRARLARVSEELVDTQSHSRSESEKSKLALDTAVREVIESKRKNDELTRTSSALSAQLSRAQEETKDLSHDLAEVESRAELMRKKWAEATLKEREMFDKELAVMTDKVQLFEDAILRAGRDKLSGLAKIERLEKSLEGEKERGVGLEQMVKRMEETNEQQLGTLVDLDQINGNLRAELGTTQTRLRSAEDKVGKTVVSLVCCLEKKVLYLTSVIISMIG
jgi:chromosome segregation ATPase